MQSPSDVDHRRELARDDRLGLPGLALGERLADADDRRQAVAPAPPAAFSATSSSLSPWHCAPLRVADDDVAAAELGEHRRRDLAGVGARVVARAVLRAPGDRRSPCSDGHLLQVRRRHADRHLGGAADAPPAAPAAAPRWRRGCRSSSSCRRRARLRRRATTSAPACRCAGSSPSAHARAPPRRPGRPGRSPA